MRVLITGGAGFLGAALARRLVGEGHAVLVLDDLSSGDESTLGPGVQFTRGDVRDVPRLWTLMAGVDLLYHLAAKVSVSESILYPVDYNAVNTGGTVAVMSAARDAGLRRVVFVSSGTVYGQPAALPAPETAEARPLNPYAVSKLAAEHYVRAIGNQVRIETVILRVFNAFGPGQSLPPAHPPVVPHFLRQVRGGGSVVLHGSPPGAQTRDFIYVDDVVEALLKAGAMGGISGSTFNIGSGRETPIVELVRAIERATGRSAIVMQSPEQSGGVGRLCGDIRSAERMLGWKPRHSLDEGLKRMVLGERG